MQVISDQSGQVGASLVAARNAAQSQASAPVPTGGAPVPASTRKGYDGCGIRTRDFGASAASMRYSKSERTSLYIETQEGDIVRLRFKSRESARLDVAHVEAAGASGTDVELLTRTSQKLSIRVRGDLNADELAAIQEAIEQAGELADDFFGGDLQSAFVSASALDIDADQLATVSLRMRSRERLTYSSYGYATIPSGPAAPRELEVPVETDGVDVGSAVGAVLDPSMASPPDVSGPPEAPEGPADERAAGDTPPPEAVEASGTDQAGAPPAAETPTEPAARSLRDGVFEAVAGFFGSVLDSLSGQGAGASTGPLDLSLKLRIFEATLASLSEARSEQLPGLVNEMVDALAGSRSAPLDRVA